MATVADPALPNADPLAALKPLLAPPPVSWWPPAPGWWLLALVVLALLAAGCMWGWRRWQLHRNTRYQREAIALLAQANDVGSIAMLVRRVAISAYGREQAATSPWQALCPSLDSASLSLLAEAQYRRADSIPAEAIAALRSQVRQWIGTLPPVRPC